MKKLGKVVVSLGLAGVLSLSGVSSIGVVNKTSVVENTKYEAKKKMKVVYENKTVKIKAGEPAYLGVEETQYNEITVLDCKTGRAKDLNSYMPPDCRLYTAGAKKGTYYIKDVWVYNNVKTIVKVKVIVK